MIKFIYLFILYFTNKYNNIKLYSDTTNEPTILNNKNIIITLFNTTHHNNTFNNTKNGYDERYPLEEKIDAKTLNKLHTNFIKKNNSINILMKNKKYMLNLKKGNLFKDWDFEF
jgi:hypothetical protein